MAEASTTYKTQRAAAVRNRAAILAAAHELLGADPAASMNEIAKKAEVGAGTLYRHFPSREELILAVYQQDIEKLVKSVDAVLAAQPSAVAAFAAWFETLAAYVRVKHGLGEALHTAAAQNAVNATYAPVTAAVARLLDACVAEGSVAPGHDPADVLLIMGFLWRVSPGEEGIAQGRRLITIVLDGIRTPGEVQPQASFLRGFH
ncbi:MAG: TetR/AcrR family transcriptional regulator [Propionibacteriaceae bacterium]|jgi:AcrR family transcriptional regulator|nr:TetR/AcrR family transcriptional regulator [Propionibacteriaceae bacterium]